MTAKAKRAQRQAASAENLPLTMKVPEYGRKVLGIGTNASYDAAKRGDFPTIQVGGLLRVPVQLAMKKQGIIEAA
jgi:hypothetical protein